MKTFKLLICTLFLFSQIQAQKTRSVFRKGYVRLGISTLGSKLDNNLNPKDNVFNGSYGASTGFVFESGHIYYFKSLKKESKINYGLDWTILSATYNKLDGWDDYAGASKADYANVEGSKLSVAIASKLGPVVSFNPIEKLVIDARFQVVPSIRISDMEYFELDNNSPDNKRSFTFYNYGQAAIDDSFDAESVNNIVAFGIGTNFGISIRRKAIGLSLDYTSVKAKTNYDAYDNNGNHSFGKEKITAHSLQLKLSVTL